MNDVIYKIERERKAEMRQRAEQDKQWTAEKVKGIDPGQTEIDSIKLRAKKDEQMDNKKKEELIRLLQNFEMKLMNISQCCSFIIENDFTQDMLASNLLTSVKRVNSSVILFFYVLDDTIV